MSDYAKIADALRFTASAISDHKLEVLSLRTLNDGATAIKELTAQVLDKDYLIQQQVDEIERLRLDVKKQQEKMIGLAKKLPKRGKWVYHPKDAIEMMFTLPKCSICGHESSDALNYCPNCGSQMRGEVNERD